MRKIILISILFQVVNLVKAQEIPPVSEDTIRSEMLHIQEDSLKKDSAIVRTPDTRQNMLLVRESDILNRINSLPVYTWVDPASAARHVSPTAQDFLKLFDIVIDNNNLVSDADGVSLAGIKALSLSIRQYDKELLDQKKINEDLSKRTRSLERVVDQQKKEIEVLKRLVAELMARIPK
jgi:hypothetical protein